MTTREFKKLKINDMIYCYSEDDFTIYEYKITSIDSDGFHVKQDDGEDFLEYISKRFCKYYYKDKNKCILENIKSQMNNLVKDISDAEYEIKNLDKYIKNTYNTIEELRNKHKKFIEENVEEFI